MLSLFFNDPAATEIYTLSLHDALPIYDAEAILKLDRQEIWREKSGAPRTAFAAHTFNETFRLLASHPRLIRSEEHTSELQSHVNLVCRLLLEKKKHIQYLHPTYASSPP